METRANYVIVGIFTVAAILAAFGFVYWTSGIGDRGETAQLRVRIPGSASGLGRGSVVLFNGVKVGDVRRVYIDVSNPGVAIADASIDRLTPLTASTLADVGLAGLTGQANIELRGGDPAEPNLLDLAEEAGRIAEIEANPSAVTNLLESAQTILRRAAAVLEELEGFAHDARGPLTETVRNVEQFSEALGRNAEGVDTFLASVSSMSETLAGVSGRLESTLAAGEELIRSVDREQVAAVITNIESFSRRLDEASSGLGDVMAGVDTAVGSVVAFSQSANETLARVDRIVEGVDPDAVRTAVDNIGEASVSMNSAAGDVSRLAERIGGRTEDIDRIITDAQLLTERLAQASGGLEGIMAGVDTAVGSINTLSQSANETLGKVDRVIAEVDPAAIRSAVTNFEQASVGINAAAGDVSRVAAQVGGRSEDIDRIISDAREMAERLNQASTRVDGILVRVDDLLGSGEAEGVMADASATLRSIREVADSLNARIGPITDGLARFSGQGLRDVEALVRDGRRSITRIEQAITDFERNPQRILSGGAGSVREYDGRVRR